MSSRKIVSRNMSLHRPESTSLSIVARASLRSITLHRHILDNNRGTSVAGNSDVRRASTNTTANLVEVVGGPGSLLPGLAAVGGGLELSSAAVGVDDLGAEPVLAGAGLHVDGERAGDRAGHVVPGQVDDADGLVGELGEGVREEVEVVLAAARAFVDNLAHMLVV